MPAYHPDMAGDHDPDRDQTAILPRPGTASTAVLPVPARYSIPGYPGVGQFPDPARSHPPTGNWYPPVPVAAVHHNNFAVVGATVGSIAFFLSFIPVIGLIAWLLAPLGLAISMVGLLIGLPRRTGRFGALYGLLTSGAALVVCFGWLLLLFG